MMHDAPGLTHPGGGYDNERALLLVQFLAVSGTADQFQPIETKGIALVEEEAVNALIEAFKKTWPVLEALTTAYAEHPTFLWRVGELFNGLFEVIAKDAPAEAQALLPTLCLLGRYFPL
jgi:hypothetical protein